MDFLIKDIYILFEFSEEINIKRLDCIRLQFNLKTQPINDGNRICMVMKMLIKWYNKLNPTFKD